MKACWLSFGSLKKVKTPREFHAPASDGSIFSAALRLLEPILNSQVDSTVSSGEEILKRSK